MLVLRSWLTTYESRRGRLKHLVALAPATFGSPLAHKGRGYLGALFKGNRVIGPDFLEAGDLILDGLELGSRFTWDLTHQDILCKSPFYGSGADSPYVYIFCGTASYGGLRKLVNEPGTDGTVRWAGCALNTKKITIDLSRNALPSTHDAEASAVVGGLAEQGSGPQSAAPGAPDSPRVSGSLVTESSLLSMPFWPIAGKNHATILSEPGETLLDLVFDALQVQDIGTFMAWQKTAEDKTRSAKESLTRWQQFVVRAVDERGDPIFDYHVELFTLDAAGEEQPIEFDLDVHAYGADKSLRCFHVNLDELFNVVAETQLHELWLRLIASTGSTLVGYHGVNSEKLGADMKTVDLDGVWDAKIRLPLEIGDAGMRLFFPFTTTFVEIKLNRDPIPFGANVNNLVQL
jgi:hypothetical protein